MCFKYGVTLKVDTVAVKLKILGSKKLKVLLWLNPLQGSQGGKGSSQSEAALPADRGRHPIHSDELFVAV